MKSVFNSPKGNTGDSGLSQVCMADNLIYISGQIAYIPETGEYNRGSIEEQTRQIMVNLKGIMEDLGLTLEHIIKTNIFLTDINEFERMNEVYKEYFSGPRPPARQTVGCTVWGGLNIEISCVAVKEID